MSRVIRTIGEMEDYFYIRPFRDPTLKGQLTKTAGAVTSSVSGVYNAKYGAELWAQLNQEANLFGALPKMVWSRTGWRVITARSEALGSGGVAEDAAIPTATHPDISEISTKPKTVAHTYEVTEIQMWLASNGEDDAALGVEQLRKVKALEHREHINKMLSIDVGTAAGNNLESIDRVVSSNSEVSDVGIGLTAGDSDIYGIDRDAAASWADAYVNHASGVDRALTEALIRSTLNTVAENGGNTQFIMTGYDTYNSTIGLFQNLQRFIGNDNVQFGVNGIQTAEGVAAGVTVSTIFGKPILVNKETAKDTISRMYFLDSSDPEGFGEPRLGIGVAKPTLYFENADPITVGKFSTKGVYRTVGELICKRFSAQGKLRDLL